MPAVREKSKNGSAPDRQTTGRPKPERAKPERQTTGRGSSRSMWKGVISFGMVAIPVRLQTATRSKDISFNLLHAACRSRLQQKRWCPACEREAPWDEIVRGYAYAKDRYVLLTEEDFDKLPLASKHTISISAFVEAAEIDPIYYEKTYYLEPDAAGSKPFALLWNALERENKVGVAKIALREKERLCVLRPHEGTIALETLFYSDEILEPTADVARMDVPEREMDLAVQIIQHLSETFEPDKYRDEYRDALNELIEAKVQGEEPVFAPEAEPGNIIDLMAALRQTLEASRKDEGDGTKAKRSGKAA